ncbi:MAG: lipid A biosynthesis acyltransferase [Ideonella sp. MAG2]|nr:MAG: lipid A biosynthesis acyltransferase [Ideonella sp. MAG2]
MMSLLRWLAQWPLPRLQALGAGLGWLTWACSPSYRRRLAQNALLAGLTPQQRRASVAEAGRMVVEALWLWLMPPAQRLDERVRWQGAEWVDQALSSQQGLVFFTPHLGSFEVSARAIIERWGHQRPLTVMYRPARSALLRELEEGARARPGLSTVPASLGGVRQMLRALRKGEMVGLLPDQVPPLGQGVWAPFFGQAAYTITLAARLVTQTGAQALVVWCERLPKGQGFVMHVEPLGEVLEASDDDAAQSAAATAINRAMERVIMQKPEQYLWGYHRYKQPRGQDATGGTSA